MVICGNQVRLNNNECEMITFLTGVDARNVKTVSQLERQIKRGLELYKRDDHQACFARRVLSTFLPA